MIFFSKYSQNHAADDAVLAVPEGRGGTGSRVPERRGLGLGSHQDVRTVSGGCSFHLRIKV